MPKCLVIDHVVIGELWHAPKGIHDVGEENPRDSTPDRRYGEVFIREPIGGGAIGVRAAVIDPN